MGTVIWVELDVNNASWGGEDCLSAAKGDVGAAGGHSAPMLTISTGIRGQRESDSLPQGPVTALRAKMARKSHRGVRVVKWSYDDAP